VIVASRAVDRFCRAVAPWSGAVIGTGRAASGGLRAVDVRTRPLDRRSRAGLGSVRAVDRRVRAVERRSCAVGLGERAVFVRAWTEIVRSPGGSRVSVKMDSLEGKRARVVGGALRSFHHGSTEGTENSKYFVGVLFSPSLSVPSVLPW
jgi:hypothetical protein